MIQIKVLVKTHHLCSTHFLRETDSFQENRDVKDKTLVNG